MQLGLYLQLNSNHVSYVMILRKEVALRLVSEDPINDNRIGFDR